MLLPAVHSATRCRLSTAQPTPTHLAIRFARAGQLTACSRSNGVGGGAASGCRRSIGGKQLPNDGDGGTTQEVCVLSHHKILRSLVGREPTSMTNNDSK